jgi:TonB family protein
MKILLFILLFSSMSFAQVDVPLVEFPDEEATFPCHTFYNYDTLGNVIGEFERCGASAMMTWIGQNVVYPQTSVEVNEQGRVFLNFIVERDGSISNVNVVRGVSPDLDREAKRVVSRMPNWIPGKVAGRAVRSSCRLPINFKLN